MAITKRRKPYFWVTWLAAALSGDRTCEFAPWLKGSYQFDKVEETEEKKQALAKWRTDHSDAVRRIAEDFRSRGYDVTLEDQNKFTVRGKNADVGGCADIVAVNADEARVVDVKTGKRKKDEHFWQIVVYLLMLPRVDARFMANKRIVAELIYVADGTNRTVEGVEADAEAIRIFARITDLATKAEPKKTPGMECRDCDIADCLERKTDDAASVDTEDF